MRTVRLLLTGTVILALLGGLGGAAMAQAEQDGGTGASTAGEPLYEVTIPQAHMPPILGKINLERHELSPGFEASIGIGNEAIRGKSLYVAEGELRVTPMVDAVAWQGDETVGGDGRIAPAGEPIGLSTGDVLYLPAVAYDRLDPDGVTVLQNAGDSTAVLLGHHAHDSSIPDVFPGWPSGMTGAAVAVGYDPDALAEVMAGDAVYRLQHLSVEPGATVTADDDAVIALVAVESGVLGQRSVSPDREFSMEWGSGSGRSLDDGPRDATTTWSSVGTDPLELLMLSISPTAIATTD